MSEKMVLTTVELDENALLNKAITYAVTKHSGGLRKGTNIPYIVHPLEAMHILFLMKADKALMAAGVLHDTVEDTDVTLDDIAKEFGQDIAGLVASHTEKDKNLPWKTRKEIALAEVAKANKREKMLVLADKLANIRAMARDYDELGDALWQRFNRGKEQQSWYYKSGVEALAELREYKETAPLYNEFAELVNKVFNN